jgi:hypothetical protein
MFLISSSRCLHATATEGELTEFRFDDAVYLKSDYYDTNWPYSGVMANTTYAKGRGRLDSLKVWR